MDAYFDWLNERRKSQGAVSPVREEASARGWRTRWGTISLSPLLLPSPTGSLVSLCAGPGAIACLTAGWN